MYCIFIHGICTQDYQWKKRGNDPLLAITSHEDLTIRFQMCNFLMTGNAQLAQSAKRGLNHTKTLSHLYSG